MFREGRTATELACMVAHCMETEGIMRLDIFPDGRFNWMPSITSDADARPAQREANVIADRLRQHFFLVAGEVSPQLF